MKKLFIILLVSTICLAGDWFDHGFFAFQYLNKPLDQIRFIDHVNAKVSHWGIDGVVAENGTNLIYYQTGFYFIALAKAESKGLGKQWKMAVRDGALFDVIDKGLTGGAIQYQLEQIPVIGEYVSLYVPHLLNEELIHNIYGYPKPTYSMTEGQYFWFRMAELGIFWLECDYLKVENNRIYAEIKL